MNRNRLASLLVAAGAVIGTGSVAQAQYVINVTGATLFANFFNAPASTNDYIDVDGDGFARRFNTDDSLAPGASGLPITTATTGQNNPWWVINYRANGSVTGFQEIVSYSSTFVTNADGVGQPLSSSLNSTAQTNRTNYESGGVLISGGNGNAANPGGAPFRTNPTTLQAVQPGASTDGMRIDIASLDVPGTWAVKQTGTPAYNKKPLQAGYGANPALQRSLTGTTLSGAGTDNLLVDLGSRNLNVSAPDSNTIFDNAIAAVPISFLVNQGVGRAQATQSELAHLFITGRLPNGENLTAITREVGSGTRNGAMNSIGIDPSWAIGEGVGANSANAEVAKVGPTFIPGTRTGSGDLENQLFNVRLGIGYTGSERSLSNGINAGKSEVLAIRNDLQGGIGYFRPTISNILNNDTTESYRIGGLETFCTLGDPRNASEVGGTAGNTNPRMPNANAAAYVNNITGSIAAISADPTGSESLFTPGEYMAKNYVLRAAAKYSQSSTDGNTWVTNPVYNNAVRTYVTSVSVLRNLPTTYGSVNMNGKVPFRSIVGAPSFTDTGVSGNTNATYVNEAGATITYGSNLTSRNRIAGDFNGDGLRNVNDAGDMVAAYKKRQGTGTWTAPAGTGAIAGAPGTDAIIEVLGDFNGDGNFNAKDLRFWADGLAIDATTGNLDRKAGFTALDTAFAGNLFGTALPAALYGPRTYSYGASRADIAGAAGTTPGWAPVGNDGIVDAKDINYIFAQIRNGDVTWSNLGQAVGADLSADMNGDLVINKADITEVLQNVLCTRWWDVNLDGTVDQADKDIVTAHLGQAGGWAEGDVNGDGIVDINDLSLICAGDFNGDGSVDFFDYLDFVDAFSSNACHADFNGDGVIDFFDYLDFVNAFTSSC